MQLHKKTEVDLADKHSGESISGVPIKKRLFHLSHASSPSQETCSISHSCRGQPKLVTESLVSENSAALALDTNISNKEFVKSSSALSSQRSYLFGGVNTSLLHRDAVPANHEGMELKKATSTIKGSNVVESLDVENRLSLCLDMKKGKQFSQLSKSEMIKGDRITEEKFATGNASAFKEVDTSVNSSKQEKVETCPLDLPLAKGVQCLHQKIYNDLDSNNRSAHCSVNRENWDLNVPMEVWGANSNDSAMEDDMDGSLNQRARNQQEIDKCLVQTTSGSTGSDLTSVTSVVESSQYNPRLRNMGMPADDSIDYQGGLDLQLRLPSRPELRISWGKIDPFDLSLSLTRNLPDASCRVVKPEPCENGSQKETETSQLSSLKSVGIRHVKPEPCDGSLQGEASNVAITVGQKSSLSRVVKAEPPHEVEGKSPNLELDSHRMMSCGTGDPQGKDKHVVLNSNAVPDANMLHNDSSVMPGNAKIKSGESTCRVIDATTLSGPNTPCKAKGVLTDICSHHNAEGSTSKPSDIAVVSVISDEKGCNAKEGEIRDIAEVAATLIHEPVVSDLKEPMAYDGMSEGSAEMDCSDDEYYTSSKFVAGDDHTDRSSVPLGGNHQEGMDSPAEIQIEQFEGNVQHVDAPQGLSGARDNIIRLGGVDVEDEGNELRDPVPQCVNEVSCEYEEKGEQGHAPQCANEVPCVSEHKIHENVATNFIGSDGVPVTTEIHSQTKGKQIVSEEARSGHSAENFDGSTCHDKKGVSCLLTTDLHESSATRVLRASSSSKRLLKPSQGATENHLGKQMGLVMKSNSIKEPSRVITKSNKDHVARRQMNVGDANVSIKNPELPEKDSKVSGTAIKNVDDVGKHSNIKNVDNTCMHRESKKVSSPTITSFGQSKSISARPIPSGFEKERLIDKQRLDKFCYQGRRPLNFDSQKNQDQTGGKSDSDYMTTRRDGNRRFGWTSDTQYAPEFNNSRKHRFARPSKGLEVPFTVDPNGYVGSAGRILRSMDDRPHQSSRFPPWRQSSGLQEEGVQTVGCPIRNDPNRLRNNTNRFIGREVHDDLQSHEKIMRHLPDEMIDNLMYSHPSLQYEPNEDDLMQRGRSFSPIQRRHPPGQLYRSRSPRQWSSPGRTPEMVIDKHPELIRRGTSPVVRGDMLRSHPHLVRRNASPSYSRLPNDMRETSPVDDLDLPRPDRILQRNNRRFDLDPHETAEYLGSSQFDDQFVDNRGYRDRRGPVQPWRPHHDPGEEEEDTLLYPVDEGCHRPMKFCPDGEVPPARGSSSREFGSNIRARLGNPANRLRTIPDQGEDYRFHGKQGWRAGGPNDARLKRRKF